ncbi:MAG: M20 family metallo-hydrolase [Acidimicrobiales bacterium]
MSRLPSPDLARVSDDLETLASHRDLEAPGWTRRVFSRFDRAGREWVAQRMEEAGLTIHTDAAANLIGRLPGAGGLPGAIVTGSHTDTVYGGGRYDGIVGVLGAIEAVRCLRAAQLELRHDLVVVDFLGEEPNDFGLSCVGSRAISGALDEGHLALLGPEGRSLGEALASAGGQPSALAGARWPDDLHCYVELHIEQGPVLEQARVPIGVVTGIVGIHRLLARIEGQPDHAGTTPMSLRRDALSGAAEVALAIERLASGGVATTGRLEIRPGAHNVVPGEADLWAEARSAHEEWLENFGRNVADEIEAIGARRHLGTTLSWISREPPVTVTAWVAAAIDAAARSLGIEPLKIPSGAGHDASHMARLGPMGMVFVPSRAGRSHCPEEWTDLEDICRGIAVLAESLVVCDQREEERRGRRRSGLHD